MSQQSNIGKEPIKLSSDVKVEVTDNEIKVTGSKGTLSRRIPKGIEVKLEEGKVLVVVKGGLNDKFKAIHGTTRSLIANMVVGVSEGWTKNLEMVGTGYRAEVAGDKLTLIVGYSHPVLIEAPENISFTVQKNVITITGIDKEMVGLIADRVRSVRPPEPYKGKGIKYEGEIIRRKAGKAAKAQGAA